MRCWNVAAGPSEGYILPLAAKHRRSLLKFECYGERVRVPHQPASPISRRQCAVLWQNGSNETRQVHIQIAIKYIAHKMTLTYAGN